MVVTGTYNLSLVILSVAVACFASYTALDLGWHATTARKPDHRRWLAAAAITMGGGIWSMHFIGMLAFSMPIPMSYDIGLTFLSLMLAIIVTSAGFYAISRPDGSQLKLALSGIFVGLGIVAMHYTGMAGMRGPFELSYDAGYVALSVLIAIGAAWIALWLAFRTTKPGQRVIASIVMGIAISGMHYTGMRAAIFAEHGSTVSDPAPSFDQIHLALAVACITFAVLAGAMVISILEQRRAEQDLIRAREDLAHSNRLTALGQLAASLAHEIKQPIAGATINATACVNWLARDPPDLDEARKAATNAERDAKRAADIIDRIRRGSPRKTPRSMSSST
jgi:NO-binding membrane sensor protein with MHYT domain